MPTHILRASVGAGKTEAALQRLTTTLNNPDRPFARAWVLLATKRQEVSFRQRLVELQDGQDVYFNAEFFNFYELNARLLRIAGKPPRRILESARIGLLRTIMAQLLAENELAVFKAIAEQPGFLRIVADLIYEFKQNRIVPENFTAAAKTDKDRELALIYQRYQQMLIDYNLVDREGEGWLAVSALEDQALASDVDLLLVDGYDQFTRVQAQLLARLSQQVRDVAITLTYVPERETVIGRRFQRALERLQDEHAAIQQPVMVKDLTDQIERHDELRVLAAHIGQPIAPDERYQPTSQPTHIRLIEAPEPAQEVAAVLRDVKRQLLSGVAPDDVLIALRDWPRYHTHFETYERLYGLPLVRHYAQPLSENPALAVLVQLLELAGDPARPNTAFRRRPLLDVLRSPYVQVDGLDDDALTLLERISTRFQVLGGRDNWLGAIDRASVPDQMTEDGEEIEPLTTMARAMDLSLALQTFMDHVTPPAQATVSRYVAWIEALIGPDPLKSDDADPEAETADPPFSVGLLAAIRAVQGQAAMDHIVSRDAAAIRAFKEILRGLVSTQDLLRVTLDVTDEKRPWTAFFADLQATLRTATPDLPNPIRSGRVLVTSATEARGLPHQHVYILGLSEGVFPAQTREDPLYLDSERKELRERDERVFLQTQAERSDDDGIFYELISLPRQTLTLSRPSVREGKPWNPSHLWRLVREVFAEDSLTKTTFGVGELIPAEAAAARDEAMLAAVAQHGEDAPALRAWLQSQAATADSWRHIERGYRIESRRLSRQPYDADSGIIAQPDLLRAVQDQLSDTHTWSASQLREYGVCPYRFFANRLLRLAPLEEPQEGLDALQLGSLNHSILEQTYALIRDDGLPINAGTRDEALDILRDSAAEVFETAPETFKFKPSPLWEHEKGVLLRRLERLIEQDFSPQSPLVEKFNAGDERQPYALEMKFSLPGADVQNLRIPVGDGSETIRVAGAIDRVERDGDQLIVIDYKTGSTPIKTEEMETGRNFQMMVYILALQEMLKRSGDDHLTVRGGFFWHIRNRQISGKIDFEKNSVEHREIVAQAQAYVASHIARARSGDFAVHPSQINDGKCDKYCDFYQLCRLQNTHQHKSGGARVR